VYSANPQASTEKAQIAQTPVTGSGAAGSNTANQSAPATISGAASADTANQPAPATSSGAARADTTNQSAPAPPAAGAPPSNETSDPYGFTAWLNSTRAAYGLGAVGYDPNLSNWAAVNNNHQASRGIGHFVMGPARRQNSAMGAFPGIEAMWMASP